MDTGKGAADRMGDQVRVVLLVKDELVTEVMRRRGEDCFRAGAGQTVLAEPSGEAGYTLVRVDLAAAAFDAIVAADAWLRLRGETPTVQKTEYAIEPR